MTPAEIAALLELAVKLEPAAQAGLIALVKALEGKPETASQFAASMKALAASQQPAS